MSEPTADIPTTPVLPPARPASPWLQRWDCAAPYVVLALVCWICHGFILSNDGPMWDGWYWLNWLENKNWAPMKEYTSAQGLPLTLWVFAALTWFPSIVAAGMWGTFLSILLQSILIYHLARKVAPLTRGEALAIAALTIAIPLFNANQDFPVFGLTVFRTLFYLAIYCAVIALERRGISHWVLRTVAFVLSVATMITNGALLFFYGGFFLLMFHRYRALTGAPIRTAAWKFPLHYPDLLLLPPFAFLFRLLFIPQFGWYAIYNKPQSDLGVIARGFWSFFAGPLAYHAWATGIWLTENPLTLIGIAAAGFLAATLAARWTAAQRSELPSYSLTLWGAALLFFAIAPLAIIGKGFAPIAVGGDSRHNVLVDLPIALLLFSGVRSLAFLRPKKAPSNLLLPITAGIVFIFAGEFRTMYVRERAELLFSRSLLHNCVRTDAVRQSSVITLAHSFNVVDQNVYATYGFASAFGELTRLVTRNPPVLGSFHQPTYIHWFLRITSVIPNEYNRINPAGAQVLVLAERNRGTDTDEELVSRYRLLKADNDPKLVEGFLASLTKLEVRLMKPGTPLDAEPAPVQSDGPPSTVPTGDFTNGLGMKMIKLAHGFWVATFETQQREYETLMQKNPSMFRSPSHPVETVSWFDANEFCRRLTERENLAGRIPSGFQYRLPTVAESTVFRADADPEQAVMWNQTALPWHTAPVGSRKPNKLGICDALGNVSEWCLDDWEKDARFKVSTAGSWIDHSDMLRPYAQPLNKNMGELAVVGTEWLYGPLRNDYPDQAFWNRGFRCVLAPIDPRTNAVIRKW